VSERSESRCGTAGSARRHGSARSCASGPARWIPAWCGLTTPRFAGCAEVIHLVEVETVSEADARGSTGHETARTEAARGSRHRRRSSAAGRSGTEDVGQGEKGQRARSEAAATVVRGGQLRCIGAFQAGFVNIFGRSTRSST